MNICKNCGCVFDEPMPGRPEPCFGDHGDPYDCDPLGLHHVEQLCPRCGANYEHYEEAASCRRCGGYDLPEKLVNGLCMKCLSEKMTPLRGVRYLQERGDLVDFACDRLFLIRTPNGCTPAFREAVDLILDRLIRRKPTALAAELRAYILDGENDVYHWAEWLEEKGEDK